MNYKNNTMMKHQFFFFLVALLLSVATTAQQRTFTKSVSTNYATKQVTFNISWAAGSRGTYSGKVYNSKVWVLVDYQEIQSGMSTGAWKRADIDVDNLPANCSKEGTNTKGFWYQGQAMAAQNATITITLKSVPSQFKWCVFASDCPPNAVKSGSSYTLHGTPPFVLITSSGTVSVDTKSCVTDCITAITDATMCPGDVSACCGSRDKYVSSSGCCTAGLTLVGGYCRDLNADNAYSVICGGLIGGSFEMKKTSVSGNSSCVSPWRLPSYTEAKCMYASRNSIGLMSYLYLVVSCAAGYDQECNCQENDCLLHVTGCSGSCKGADISCGSIGCHQAGTTNGVHAFCVR